MLRRQNAAYGGWQCAATIPGNLPSSAGGTVRYLRIAAVLLVTAASIAAQAPPLEFEVASIKRTTAPIQERSGIIPTPGRFVAEKIPAAALIGAAYRGE